MHKHNLRKGVNFMKNVTLKDVAKAAGVSYATVSRALSGSSQIGSETRERVLKLCDEMGYTTNFVARSMVTKRTSSDLWSPLWTTSSCRSLPTTRKSAPVPTVIISCSVIPVRT